MRAAVSQCPARGRLRARFEPGPTASRGRRCRRAAKPGAACRAGSESRRTTPCSRLQRSRTSSSRRSPSEPSRPRASRRRSRSAVCRSSASESRNSAPMSPGPSTRTVAEPSSWTTRCRVVAAMPPERVYVISAPPGGRWVEAGCESSSPQPAAATTAAAITAAHARAPSAQRSPKSPKGSSRSRTACLNPASAARALERVALARVARDAVEDRAEHLRRVQALRVERLVDAAASSSRAG